MAPYPKILAFVIESRHVEAIYLAERPTPADRRAIETQPVLGWALVEEADGTTHVEGLVTAVENGQGILGLAGDLPGLFQYYPWAASQEPTNWEAARRSTHRLARRRRPRKQADHG